MGTQAPKEGREVESVAVSNLFIIEIVWVFSLPKIKKNSGFRVLFEFTCQAQDKVRVSYSTTGVDKTKNTKNPRR
jgi:hypothetical protein